MSAQLGDGLSSCIKAQYKKKVDLELLSMQSYYSRFD